MDTDNPAARLAELQAMLDSAGDGIYAVDSGGNCTFINRAAAGMLGYSPQDCLGRNLRELIHPAGADGSDTLSRPDGTSMPVRYSERPILLNGRTHGSVVTIRDVTQSDGLFRTLVDTIAQLMWMADESGWIFWYNRGWYEYTGTKPEQMEGWGWQSVHDPVELPSVMERWTASIRTGQPFEMVFPLRGADGVFRPFLTRIIPIRDSAGKIERWFGTNTEITKQRQAEEALRLSQERLRASLDASGTGTYRWDTRSEALELDESLLQLAGLPGDAALVPLERFLALVHPDDLALVRDQLERARRGNADIEVEFRVVRPDGGVCWLYNRGKSFLDAETHAPYVTGACVDITARKRSDDLMRHQARLSGLGADVGVALTRANTIREMLQMCAEAIVRRLDAAFARIWTLDAGENTLELQASAGMYTHINGGHARVPVGKFKIGLIAQERQPHLTNDVASDERVGDHAWAEREGLTAFAGYPLIVEDYLVGVVALFAKRRLGHDVLDSLASVSNNIAIGIQRKRHEAALRVSEARKTAILETALDCVITIDDQSRIHEFNPAAERTFGYSREEVLGHSLPELIIPEELRARHYAGMQRYLRTGEAAVLGRRVELNAIRRDGTEFPIELAVNRIRMEWPALFTATLRDITDRRRAEQDLLQAKEAAEQANHAKSSFLANMSHELRTPLNAIIGYSEMLQEEAEELGGSAFTNDLKKIHAAGRHLLGLISDILDLSKIEAGRMDFYPETFALASLIQDVASTVAPLVAKNGSTLEVTTADDLGAMYADPTKVRQSLFNLLSNAAKFTTGGKITLQTDIHRENGQELIRFSVTDTGIGIRPELIGRLFQPFSQLDHSTTRKFGGTGLGLALTRRFCQMMGGDIGVESEIGKGSRFTITLPRNTTTGQAERQTAAAVESGYAVPGKTTVLVIDDDATARDLMLRYLSREGVHAVLASSGEEGLRLAREIHPQVITLDVMMPGMDGWAVLQALKADAQLCAIPVVMATIVGDRELGYALGAADYLIKPITREMIAKLLAKHHCEPEPCVALLVEDDEASRDIMNAMLRREGWEVETASDGLEALARVEARKPNLILLDLMMPNMDGFEFALQLRRREKWRSIPIVVLTAKDLTAEDRARLNGHVQRIVLKGSFSRDDLLRELREVVSGHAAQPGQTQRREGREIA